MTLPAGIDISHHQETTPALTGLSFAFARATFGDHPDRLYATHAAAFRRAGIVRGAYAFGTGDATPEAQAAAFLEAAAGAELLALDLEANRTGTTMTAAQATAFIAAVHAAGRRIGLYHSLWRFPLALGQDWNWVAAWRTTPPLIPWTFWQHRGAPLDLDSFNGTLTELRALAGRPLPRPRTRPVKAFHTVVRGDSLWAIAKHHGITLARLLAFAENARFRANPSLIHPGDRVRVR